MTKKKRVSFWGDKHGYKKPPARTTLYFYQHQKSSRMVILQLKTVGYLRTSS